MSPDNCPPGCSHETFHYCGEAGTHCDRHCVCTCRICRPGWTLDDVRALCRGLGWSQSKIESLGIETWGSDQLGLWIMPSESQGGLRMICTANREDRTLYEPESVVAWLLST